MPNLIVKNSFSQIVGFSEEDTQKVKQALSYTDQEVVKERGRLFKAIQYANYKRQIKYCYALKKRMESLPPANVCWLGSNGHFPTGHLDKVKKVLESTTYKLDDKRGKPESYHIFRWENKPPENRYYQNDMLSLARINERGVFESAVGSGKSLVITNIIKEHGVNTLIVVPSLALLEQLYRTLELAFGSKNIQKISSGTLKCTSKKLKPIRLVNIQSLSAMQKNGTLTKLISDIDMIIIDEIHHAGAKSYTDLLAEIDHVYYRYGFTGTFLRNDSKTMDMHGFLSNVLYEYGPQQAVKDGFLTPLTYHVHKLEGGGDRNYQKEYNHNYCGNPDMLKKINEILKTQKNTNVLILVDRKEKSGEIIHKYLSDQGIENTYISGDDDKEIITDAIEAFNDKKINILIGSQVIGEGVDVHSTDVLILATGGKSEVKFIQSCGRAVRLHKGKTKAHIHDFQLMNTMYLEKHFYQRLTMFRDHFAGEVKVYDSVAET